MSARVGFWVLCFTLVVFLFDVLPQGKGIDRFLGQAKNTEGTHVRHTLTEKNGPKQPTGRQE